MDELIKLLDKNLDYVEHEIIDNTIYVKVISNRENVCCKYCNTPSKKVHSRYNRSFQDLPIQGKKVIIILENRKMFCLNPNCNKTTFAETFDFLSHKAKKTNRLENQIINISINVSSLAAEQILKKNIANVGKSTICNLLKKKRYKSLINPLLLRFVLMILP
ncbi:transposase family protein [Anaeromicrobium sp.]|jgi:transposase|uniref:transposase family protein n=1 Tax=Anaeromicrobium sp. TaxID=1929132 RepID=UPI003FA4CF5B